jgi:hypothetical protein
MRVARTLTIEERAGRNTLLLIVPMSSAGYPLIGLVATIARLRFAGRGRVTRILRTQEAKGHFYLRRLAAFLFCVDK